MPLYIFDQSEKVVTSATAVLADGTTIFTIAGGPIVVLHLLSYCVTANDGTASTLRWSHDPTDGAAATFSGVSASLASVAAGASLSLSMNTLSTVPTLSANGPNLPISGNGAGIIMLMPGIITTTIATGPSTGTWRHHLRYAPMADGVSVT